MLLVRANYWSYNAQLPIPHKYTTGRFSYPLPKLSHKCTLPAHLLRVAFYLAVIFKCFNPLSLIQCPTNSSGRKRKTNSGRRSGPGPTSNEFPSAGSERVPEEEEHLGEDEVGGTAVKDRRVFPVPAGKQHINRAGRRATNTSGTPDTCQMFVLSHHNVLVVEGDRGSDGGDIREERVRHNMKR